MSPRAGHVRRAFAAALFAGVTLACDSSNQSRSEMAAEVVRPRDDPRPNILVLMLDTLSARRVGAYGAGNEVTPRLDAFARDARVFERAVSTSNWTLPSHASIFTGLYPTSHGTIGGGGRLSEEFPTLAELLHDAGYATYLFTANPYVSREHGLDQGFEIAEYAWDEKWQTRIRSFMDSREYEQRPESRFVPFKDAGTIIKDAFLEWDAGRVADSRPFFAFLNFMEAHQPWYVTRDERRPFLAGPLLDQSFELEHGYARRHAFNFGYGGYSDQDLAVVRGLYDAVVHRLDAVLGELLDELEKRGRFEDSVIVVVSDHGDGTGEHGVLGHEYALYDSLLSVPLLIRHPALFPAGRTPGPVQSLDLYPTLLEVAGVELAAGQRVEGRSLFDFDANEARLRPIVGEYLKPKTRPLDAVAKEHRDLDRKRWLRPLRSIEVDGYKLILRDGGDAELYHISADPSESDDIAQRDPVRVAALLARLEAWDAQRPKRPAVVSGSEGEARSDAQHRARLEALGYLEPTDSVQE